MNLLATLSAGTGLQKIGERPVASGEGERHFLPGDGREASGEGLAPSPSPLPRWGRGLGEGETPLISLRQFAPPGFITKAFAVDWSAGCTS